MCSLVTGVQTCALPILTDDPHLIANMSVWRDIDALAAFVYRTPDHLTVMNRRKEWFEHMAVYQVLWWVPAGHRPTVAAGLARLAMLDAPGPTAEALTFKRHFSRSEGPRGGKEAGGACK